MKRGKKLFTYLLVLVMLLVNTVTGVAAELDEPLQEATQIVHEDGSGLLSEGGLRTAVMTIRMMQRLWLPWRTCRIP